MVRELNSLKEMTKGWFVGDFEPSILKSKSFEVAVKRYSKGDYEPRHYHLLSTEVTCVVSGSVLMNGVVYVADDIISISPGTDTDFEALEDSITVVVKAPSVRNDKYMGVMRD